MCDFYDKLEAQGKIKGQLELLSSLIKDKVLSLQQAAERMGMTVANFEIAMKELATN